MKGTDVSDAALRQAAEFLKLITSFEWPEDERLITIQRSKFIRILAWYGMIRAKGREPAPGFFERTALDIRGRGGDPIDDGMGG